MLLVTLSQGLHSLAGEGKGDGERHHREAGRLKFHQLTTEQANKREWLAARKQQLEMYSFYTLCSVGMVLECGYNMNDVS